MSDPIKKVVVRNTSLGHLEEDIARMNAQGYELHSWNLYISHSTGRVQTSDYMAAAVYFGAR